MVGWLLRGDIGVSGSLEKVGVVIGTSKPSSFIFVTDEKKHPPLWEYILVRSVEVVDGKEVMVDVIAQIDEIVTSSMALKGELSLAAAEKIREAGLVDRNVIAKARVLGYLYKGKVYQPRKSIFPGTIVYRAPRDVLKKFYSYPGEEGIFIGYLITRQDVPIYISVQGFRRHLAILAQTGAGKSYTAGVLIEELYKKGATIIILDPHADHVFLSRRPDGKKFADRVTVFRTPESTGRYNEAEIGFVKQYQVKFSDLSISDICTVCRISDRWTNIIAIIRDAIQSLKESIGLGYTPNDLISKLEQLTQEKGKSGDAIRALKYISRLEKMRVFGDASTNIEELLKPMHISVVDLSGLDDEVMDYVAYKILGDIFTIKVRDQYKYPVFVFIEEAHKFAPAEGSTLSKGIIKKIAAEGRKFGIFLVIISQRPYKVDQDVLSQCNSQIIMKLTNMVDQTAVKNSSERMSEGLLNDLPGLNVGEAVIVGEITRAPVMVKVRSRETKEGGADIDVVGVLREARMEAKNEEKIEEENLRELIRSLKDRVELPEED